MTPRKEDILHLRSLGFGKREIQELLGCSMKAIRKAIQGQVRRPALRRLPIEDGADLESVGRYGMTQPLHYPVPRAEDTDEPHGPVRQLMRDGVRVNEIVWRPSGAPRCRMAPNTSAYDHDAPTLNYHQFEHMELEGCRYLDCTPVGGEVQRCRAEQRRAAAYLQKNPDGPEARGAALGMSDWFAEELLRETGE